MKYLVALFLALPIVISISLFSSPSSAISSPSIGGCQPSGNMHCHGKSYPKYRCSPPVTSSTRATLTNDDFSKGGDGGGPSECDNSYHKNSELIVALSTVPSQ
ncbi:hypothetical protein ACJRO7_011879 [Eucalyptus globulus]|uniref:Uncharacterized protein n=1 Tax=Eucalyptus globulus TaxID=34317 RepID=A0ABD3LGM4_EUCGL